MNCERSDNGITSSALNYDACEWSDICGDYIYCFFFFLDARVCDDA